MNFEKNRNRVAVRLLMSCLIIFLLILISIRECPEVVLAGYAVIGRSPVCPVWQAMKGAQSAFNYRRQEQVYRNSPHLFTLIQSVPVGLHYWATPQGNFWIPGGSDEVLPVIVAQQEANIYGIGRHGVQPGDVVLDCGAHIGVFTKKALSLKAKRIIAIEPGTENIECLRRNLNTEIAGKLVDVYQKGIWDQETTLEFQTFAHNSASDSFVMRGNPSNGHTYKVAVTTIDKLVQELKLERVDFIKMDIKGSTERALNGAKETLRRFKPRLAISTEETSLDSPERIVALCKRLQPAYITECGYCALDRGRVLPSVIFLQ